MRAWSVCSPATASPVGSDDDAVTGAVLVEPAEGATGSTRPDAQADRPSAADINQVCRTRRVRRVMAPRVNLCSRWRITAGTEWDE